MKILYILISGKAGADVYFARLKFAIEKYTDLKAEVIYISQFFEKVPFLISFYLKYIRKIDFNKYDIIHTNAEFGHFFKIKNKPLLITIHHSVFDNRYQKYTSLFQKIFHYFWIKPNLAKSLRVSDKVIAVSNHTKMQILNSFKTSFKKIGIIYNGVDTDKFKPIDKRPTDNNKNNNKIRLLFVGNLTRRKGVDLLPKIMTRLGSDYILYYTSGLRTENIFRQKSMIPLGKLNKGKLIEEYNKCDILLLPTRLEGFGYAVAEAMACGKSVVATNCSSLPELIKDGENGFLCKMDNIDDFIKKITILGNNPDLRIKMGMTNRQKILETFGLEKMVKEYEKLYKDTI